MNPPNQVGNPWKGIIFNGLVIAMVLIAVLYTINVIGYILLSPY